MVEIFALWLACRNVGRIVRARGAVAPPYQLRTVLTWFGFELVAGFVAGAVGLGGLAAYGGAFSAALLSLPVSFAAARRAKPVVKRDGAARTPGAGQA